MGLQGAAVGRWLRVWGNIYSFFSNMLDGLLLDGLASSEPCGAALRRTQVAWGQLADRSAAPRARRLLDQRPWLFSLGFR
eukprot:5580415-Alexandrium_andersonii.AAC.1